jgi:transposase
MKSYFLGGDASKGYCDFILLDERKRTVEENFQLDDCYEGHLALFGFLRSFFSHHKEAAIYAGFESTGGYETNWYQFLWKLQKNFNIQVARVNPFGVKHHKKASLERIETDKISARTIAEYLINYPHKVEYSKDDCFAGLRRHWKYIRMLKKQKSQLQTTLKAQLYVAHSQLLTYCKEGMNDWTLHLLTKYPTASLLAAAEAKTVSDIPYISKERSNELISDAKKSIASMQDTSMENLIQSAAHQILHLKKSIDQQVKAMTSTYDFPEIEIMVSFIGIDHYSAFGLLLNFGAIEQYDSVKPLVSFFGMHPIYRESGDGKGGMHMSKKGRKEPRWILFNVAKSAVVHNEMIKQLYEEYQAKGKCKMSALGIIMHKILRILYGMLKHNKKYDPTVDMANRKKTTRKKEVLTFKPNKNRRYQDYSQKAPISRRQEKKRKKYKKEEVAWQTTIGGKENQNLRQ